MKYNIPVIKLGQPDDRYKFRELPSPSGTYPYHLNVTDMLTLDSPDQIHFHMVGDTGGSISSESRQDIVKQLSAQQSDFLYHLGDIVYHYGEADQYQDQFFKPFEVYPNPIFAIAGNHDADVNPVAKEPYQSLEAFSQVFCENSRHKIKFSGNSTRESMIQPNVYWTLDTPLVTIIGLNTNVPKYGVISAEQHQWFREELLAAPKDKMLMVCLHHSPYSSDTNHGSSLDMIIELDSAFAATGITPDIVLSGHVHNYQRFEKIYDHEKAVLFIVAGSGGFEELHAIAELDDSRFTAAGVKDVNLMAFNDNSHGFLKIVIMRNNAQLTLNGEYYISGVSEHAFDTFSLTKSVIERQDN